MKLIALTISLVVSSLLNTTDAFAQVKPSLGVFKPKTQAELEAKFDELDKSPDDLIITVESGNKPEKDKSATNVIIKVEKKIRTALLGPVIKQNLVAIDLTELAGPSDAQIRGMIDEAIAISSRRTMCGSVPSVLFAQVGITGNFQLREDYRYDEGHYRITVPNGFIYDRASIPAGLWWIVTKDNVGDPGPLIHDYLYRYGGRVPENQVSPYKQFSRLEADILLRDLMAKCGVKKWRRDLVYGTVRTVSRPFWQATDNNFD